MNITKNAITLSMLVLLGGCISSSDDSDQKPDEGADWELREAIVTDLAKVNQWYTPANERVQSILDSNGHQTSDKVAKNIILFIADGMGISSHTSGRIYTAQEKHKNGEYPEFQGGEEYQSSFEQFPFAGSVKTYASNGQTPDSSSTASAIMSGVKINKYAVNVMDSIGNRDCPEDGTRLLTALDLAKLAGKGTGVVTNTRITHATPASTYASIQLRDIEDDTHGDKNNCVDTQDIAEQLVRYRYKFQDGFEGVTASLDSGIDVVLGGGSRSFYPAEMDEGRRQDGVNLVEEWLDDSKGLFVNDKHQLAEANELPVFGLFGFTHLEYEIDRENRSEEPSLEAMTSKAIELLEAQDNDEGYFLVIEGGRLDQAHHAGWGNIALTEYKMFEQSIAKALEMVDLDETMIVVTADHSHTFTMSGETQRGNPISGLVTDINDDLVRDDEGLPFTTLHYANSGAGLYGAHGHATFEGMQRINLEDKNTESVVYRQQAAVQAAWDGGTHAGEDIGIWATGVGSDLVRGNIEQNSIFHILNTVGDLERSATQKLTQ